VGCIIHHRRELMQGLYLYSSPPWRGIKGVGCIIRHRRELMQGCILYSSPPWRGIKGVGCILPSSERN